MNLREILRNTLTLLALCALLPSITQAQNVLYGPYTFPDPNLGNWIRNSDLVDWTADGTGVGFDDFWGTRTAIESASPNGAAIFFRGDSGGASLRSRSELNLDFTGETSVFLSFHQYYRSLQSSTELRVYDGGVQIATFPLNETIGGNVETSAADTVIIDLSAVVAGRDDVQIEFFLQDRTYFWIVDDVTFYSAYPYPRSVPDTLGTYLFNNDYPFEVFPYDDENGVGAAPYVPQQLVVKYVTGTPAIERALLRDTFGAVLVDSCLCGDLELWEIDGSNFFDPMGESSAGETINILSNKDGAGEKPIIDDVDLNFYNGVILDSLPTDTILLPLDPATIAEFELADPAAYRIAILDTGVDYLHPSIKPFIRLKPSTDCLTADTIGWNYVDGHNNPYDDNGHGTHVAGILADTLSHYNTICDYEFIPYKTHDRDGVSTLFKVTCATYQAVEDNADLINDSWGFFGQPSPVLRGAMDAAVAADILVVTAAGNDTLDLGTLKQYPACYDYDPLFADSLITVGAVDGLTETPGGELVPSLAFFSNFSNEYVDILAPGFNILSASPSWTGVTNVFRSGTSMATPMVTAAAAIAHCCNQNDNDPANDLIWAARDTVLNSWALNYSNLANVVSEGRFLSIQPDSSCIVNIDEVIEILDGQNGFFAFPNPVGESLWLRSQENRSAAELHLINAQGQVVRQWRSGQWYQEQTLGLDLTNIPTGIYFLRVLGTDYQWTGKIIKQ